MQAPQPPVTSLGKPAFEQSPCTVGEGTVLTFFFLEVVLCAAIENPPCVRSGAMLNKEIGA